MPTEVRILSRFIFSCKIGSSFLLERWDDSLSGCLLGLKVMKAVNAIKSCNYYESFNYFEPSHSFNLLCRIGPNEKISKNGCKV